MLWWKQKQIYFRSCYKLYKNFCKIVWIHFWIMLLLSRKIFTYIPYLNHLNHLFFSLTLVKILTFPWRLRILSSGRISCMCFRCSLFFVCRISRFYTLFTTSASIRWWKKKSLQCSFSPVSVPKNQFYRQIFIKKLFSIIKRCPIITHCQTFFNGINMGRNVFYSLNSKIKTSNNSILQQQ